MMMSRDGPGPDKDCRKTDYIFLIFHTILEICVYTLEMCTEILRGKIVI